MSYRQSRILSTVRFFLDPVAIAVYTQVFLFTTGTSFGVATVSAVTKPKTEAEKNAAKFPQAKSAAEQILTKAQASREVVQDFVALAESLEWELVPLQALILG